MEKLPHERLREIDDEGNNACSLCMMMNGGVCPPYMCDEAAKIGAHKFADEIERYYIPRPRFEDGEPAQWGDCAEGLEVPITAFTIHEDGSGAVGDWAVDDADWVDFSIPEGNYLKRPQPKVLDADGVEIKVGDTVYRVEGDWFGHVKGFETDAFGEHIVLCDSMRAPAEFLTHKEPDSLEKLRDEMANFDDLGYPYRPQLHKKWADRLSALIERGA